MALFSKPTLVARGPLSTKDVFSKRLSFAWLICARKVMAMSSRECLVAKIQELHGHENASHFMSYLEAKYPCHQTYEMHIKDLKAMVEAHGVVFPICVVDVPVPSTDVTEHYVESWQLGFSDSAGCRGKPKQVSIVELAVLFAESSFQSVRQPLNVTFTEANGQVSAFSIRHVVGFTRSLAAKMVLECWSELDAAQQKDLLDVVKSCLVIKVTCQPAGSLEQEFFSSMRSKFQLSESTRPDVIQLYYGWQKLFSKMGVDYAATISDHVKAFNQTSSVAGSRVSDQEFYILRILPHQSKAFVDMLEAHWDRYKSPESAVTLKSMCEKVDRKSPPTEHAVWASILKPSPEKNLIWLERQIEIFNVNQCQMMGSSSKKTKSLSFKAASCHRIIMDTWSVCGLWYIRWTPKVRGDVINQTSFFIVFCLLETAVGSGLQDVVVSHVSRKWFECWSSALGYCCCCCC